MKIVPQAVHFCVVARERERVAGSIGAMWAEHNCDSWHAPQAEWATSWPSARCMGPSGRRATPPLSPGGQSGGFGEPGGRGLLA